MTNSEKLKKAKQGYLALSHEPTTLGELGNGIVKYWRDYIKKQNAAPLLELSWEVSYSDSVSNSHNGPILFGSNFCNPRQFRGFSGRVWLCYNSTYHQSTGVKPHPSLVYTGSGGFGLYYHTSSDYGLSEEVSNLFQRAPLSQGGLLFYPLSYHFYFFLDDFPLILKDAFEKHREETVHRKLSGETPQKFGLTHRFRWMDESIVGHHHEDRLLWEGKVNV